MPHILDDWPFSAVQRLIHLTMEANFSVLGPAEAGVDLRIASLCNAPNGAPVLSDTLQWRSTHHTSPISAMEIFLFETDT